MHRTVKDSASSLLKTRGTAYRRLTAMHSGITVGVWLVLFVGSYLIPYLSPGGGLSNMSTHALISTTQVLLIVLGLLLTPFWEIGLSFVALDLTRNRRNMASDLAEGFRRLKPIGGALLFEGIQYGLVYLLSGTATSLILTLLPFPQSFYDDAAQLLKDPSTPLEGSMLFLSAIYGVIFISTFLFLASQIFYRYRMTRYLLLEDDAPGGMLGSLSSLKLMKGNKLTLLKLDLSFWWFYVPELLGMLLPLTALLLSRLQVELSPRAQLLIWSAAGVSLILRLVVHLIGKPRVAASYALFYEQLRKQENAPIVEDAPPSRPQNPTRPPWKY